MTKKKNRGLAFRNARNGLLFIAPFLIGFVLFMAVPLFNSLRMSFSAVGFGTIGFDMSFIGIENYVKALTADPDFNRLFVEELTKIGTRFPFIVIISFFIAMMLNQKFRLRGLARAIFFLPVILSSGVIVNIETNNTLLNGMASIIEEYSNTGQITLVLEQLLLGGFAQEGPVRFVLDAVNGIYTVVMGSGIQILIFLAGLQAVPASMYEAAKMEGATAWESFWKITLPLVSSLILVSSVYTIIDTCLKSDSALYTKIRTAMVNQMEYGFSSAMSWIYFVVIMAIILLVVGILSKVVFYDE